MIEVFAARGRPTRRWPTVGAAILLGAVVTVGASPQAAFAGPGASGTGAADTAARGPAGGVATRDKAARTKVDKSRRAQAKSTPSKRAQPKTVPSKTAQAQAQNDQAKQVQASPAPRTQASSAAPRARITEAGQPVVTSAVPGNGYVTVSWQSFAGTTEYEAGIADATGHSSLGVKYVGGNVLQADVQADLSSGDYTAYVCATGSFGGACSELFPFSIAPTAPGQPANVDVQRGPRALSVSWQPPADGGPVDSYQVWVTDNGDGQRTDCGPVTGLSCTISGLVYPDTYTVYVDAINKAGHSTDESSGHRPGPQPPTRPDPPTVTPGNGSLHVTWAPPADPGDGIDGYLVTANPGEYECTPDSDALACDLYGLVNGQQYTVQVYAYDVEHANRVGSETVTATPSVGPAPGAPTLTSVKAGDGKIDVAWAPGTTGAGITGYTATASPGGATCTADTASATGCTITDLTNGREYTVTVVAHGAGGDSPPSAQKTATPYGRPGAPTAVTATAGVSSIVVTWTAPANPGPGITGYTVTAEPGPATCETTENRCVLGAVAGTSYTVRVVAHAGNGMDSDVSAPSAAVVPTAPVVSAEPPATDLTLTTDRGAIDTAAPGEQIVVIGTGFAPHSTVTVTIYSTPTVLGTAVADADGNFSKAVTVPRDLAAGTHTLVAQGVDPTGAAHAMKLAVTVAAAGGGGGSGDSGASTLPVTGAGVTAMLLAGGVLVGAGGGLVAAVSRPRRRRA
ncbi:fibronectin type III domain-containing protein [Planosporangium mesophilum]|uniref:Fibronectin type-III domain-containing protein n=1 Tax=Planosporangium mesophilum TaxID=689768 RepID=A0A8J3TPJ9_9ACTN|nr:fibronectin type III domain-containing protein [Planosporangium mesophilum]NJC85901.1 hypothetical protein [Planosporangium mesophilum]GII25050.1 hypothetical protein Pme01_46470 [Planosporangium mesophilum]